MTKLKDMAGLQVGRLTVLDRGPNYGTKAQWVCLCDCGRTSTIPGYALRGGQVSCGCERSRRHLTHGQSRTRIYWVWKAMHQRCTNTKDRFYFRYGGRGIRVCKRWRSFENFIADMGPRPKRAALDRIDNDGDYSPKNCRWATAQENSRNSARACIIEHKGKSQCIQAWHEETGIPYRTLLSRVQRGWTAERALTQPVARQ